MAAMEEILRSQGGRSRDRDVEFTLGLDVHLRVLCGNILHTSTPYFFFESFQ